MNLLCIDPGEKKSGYAVLAWPTARMRWSVRYVESGHVDNEELLLRASDFDGALAIESVTWHKTEESRSPKGIVGTSGTAREFRGIWRQRIWRGERPEGTLVEMPSRDWRRALLNVRAFGNLSKTAYAALVKDACKRFVEGFPEDSPGGRSMTNEHGRDAVGLGIVAWPRVARLLAA